MKTESPSNLFALWPSTALGQRRYTDLLYTFMLTLLLSAVARGQTTFWTPPIGSSSASFLGANWSNGVPDATKDAVLNASAAAEFNNAGTYVIRDLSVSTTAGSGGRLYVQSGTLWGDDAYVGVLNTGFVSVDGSNAVWTNSSLVVGVNGDGLVVINDGAHAVAGSAAIAQSTDSRGEIAVDGFASKFDVNQSLTIGQGSIGQLSVHDGAHVSSGTGVIGSGITAGGGEFLFGTGTVLVEGLGSKWANGGTLDVGQSGTGVLTISDGGAVNNTIGRIATNGSTIGTVAVRGTGSKWISQNGLTIGTAGSGTLTVEDGGYVSNTFGTIGSDSSGRGDVRVDGLGAKWISSNLLEVGSSGAGSLTVVGGGFVSNTFASVAAANGSTGVVTVDGAGSRWTSSNDLGIGYQGTGTLSVRNSGSVVGPNTSVGTLAGSFGIATVDGLGSRLTATGLFVGYQGQGALTVSNGASLASGTTYVGDFPSGIGNVSVDGSGSIWSNSGQAVFGNLGRGALNVQHGGSVVVGGAAYVGTQGTMALNDGTFSAASLSNAGLIRGNGQIVAQLANQSGGELRVQSAEQLSVLSTGSTNAGLVSLQDGTAEFSGTLTNAAGGRITGRGVLKTGGSGLENNGNVALSNGISDVFGDVNNATGSAMKGITISGNADVTFWDDVTNGLGSLFKLSSGSTVTVFGTYSGDGIVGSANDIHLEGDISPGFSPATVDFGGNLYFSATTTLKIELGGTTAGERYDQVHVSEKLSLDGALQIALIDGFSPAAGDVFDILDWGTRSGSFSSLILPTLTGLAWDTTQLYTTGVLSVAAVGILGDFNQDGFVNAADYVLWRANPGGIYTQSDYDDWRVHFGQSAGSGSLDHAAVPEPSSMLALLLASALGILSRHQVAWREPTTR